MHEDGRRTTPEGVNGIKTSCPYQAPFRALLSRFKFAFKSGYSLAVLLVIIIVITSMALIKKSPKNRLQKPIDPVTSALLTRAEGKRANTRRSYLKALDSFSDFTGGKGPAEWIPSVNVIFYYAEEILCPVSLEALSVD
ncbi:unnamed protein product, partial [marine sediment metagenome]